MQEEDPAWNTLLELAHQLWRVERIPDPIETTDKVHITLSLRVEDKPREAYSIDLLYIIPNDSIPIEDIHYPLKMITKPRKV